MQMKTRPGLSDVPETMLWTLHNRATEAMRPDTIIDDPRAVEIYQSLDYDYEASFGKPNASHAVRSVIFDDEIRRFLSAHSDATIVNLGEGLETQRFRIEENNALWLSIDLPDALSIRERFIRPDTRHRHIALSATDRAWFDMAPQGRPVFITAQGLFMYFTEEAVKTLLQDIARRFPTATVMFDTIPVWLSEKTLRGWMPGVGYIAPRMPWGINRDNIPGTLADWLGNNAEITDLGYSAFPRGVSKWVTSLLRVTPGIKQLIPSIVRVRLKTPPHHQADR